MEEEMEQEKEFAFLISAYTEPESLCNLVRELECLESADFYIHIDRKADISPFRALLDNLGYTNIFYTKERFKVYWGGYSQVLMQQAMICEMLESGTKYSRVVNITGTDFPVAGPEQLRAALLDPDQEFIIGFDVENEIGSGVGKEPNITKFSRLYRMDTYHYVSSVILRLHIRNPYFKDRDKKMFFGSEYWALTYDCVKDIYDRYRDDIKLQTLLRYSYVPSEAWVHTMFFNSDWKSRCRYPLQTKYIGLDPLAPLTYFDYREKIKVLTLEDYDAVVGSKKLFARKIIAGKSDALVEKIKETRADLTFELSDVSSREC